MDCILVWSLVKGVLLVSQDSFGCNVSYLIIDKAVDRKMCKECEE